MRNRFKKLYITPIFLCTFFSFFSFSTVQADTFLNSSDQQALTNIRNDILRVLKNSSSHVHLISNHIDELITKIYPEVTKLKSAGRIALSNALREDVYNLTVLKENLSVTGVHYTRQIIKNGRIIYHGGSFLEEIIKISINIRKGIAFSVLDRIESSAAGFFGSHRNVTQEYISKMKHQTLGPLIQFLQLRGKDIAGLTAAGYTAFVNASAHIGNVISTSTLTASGALASGLAIWAVPPTGFYYQLKQTTGGTLANDIALALGGNNGKAWVEKEQEKARQQRSSSK